MKKVLMICLGNICRSPTAEAILRKKASERNLFLEVDSAGTSAYHAGEKSDARSIQHAEARGYEMNHFARQLTPDDFRNFDILLAMDLSNFRNSLNICPEEDLISKLRMITDYDPLKLAKEIPDPYFGGADGFDKVIDLLESCVDGFLARKKF